jgi:hypothetical protein
LAEAYIKIGQPELALEELDDSLEITKSSHSVSTPALILKQEAEADLINETASLSSSSDR